MWYVLWTTTGREEKMKELVDQLVDHSFYNRVEILYKIRNIKMKKGWEKKKEKLIPSYLFVETGNIEDFASALAKIPNFSMILQSDGQFFPLSEKEEALIRNFTSQENGVDVSKGYIEGDNIYVTEGPLKGMEGYIKKIDRHKRLAIISMNLFDRDTDVSVGLEIVEKRPAAERDNTK